MELPHILEELAYDMGELPRDAIEAAVAKRKVVAPYLLEILQDAIERIDEIIEDDNYQGHILAMYLLAQFRDTRAYPLLIELFSYPGDIPHSVAGDVLTEDLSRIFASVCGLDIEPLKHVIETPLANEYVRAACQTALVTLVGCGEIPRDLVISYFRTLFHGKLEKKPSFVWDNLISCCCSLHPRELYTEIVNAFDNGLIDTAFINLCDVSTARTEDKKSHLFRLFSSAELIEDTVSEMEKWLCPVFII